jgi:mannose-1-phosphate guanylyltransferase/mannose-6-phosphate isomerase
MKITPLILSGGSGTRLWPVSRSFYPKQFLDFFDTDSFFSKTISRIKNSEFFNPPIIVCNNEHRFLAAAEILKNNIAASAIILEPESKNTAAAIAVGALEIIKNNGTDNDLMLVMPSDHLINDNQKFTSDILPAKELALAGYLVTFGITPNHPETCYGYIKQGKKLTQFKYGFKVEKFIEKPNQKKAEELLKEGGFLFNSGIFMFKASLYLDTLKKLENDVYNASLNSYQNSRADLAKDFNFIRLDCDSFAKSPNISVDYAVMEKSDKIAVLPLNIGWNDVGDWSKIAEIAKKDHNQNSLIGNIEAFKTNNCYINSTNGLVATIGVENLIIIHLKDALLIVNKNNAQDVKELFEILKSKQKEECNFHSKILRPWGSFEVIDFDQKFKVKRIIVNSKASLSLQTHQHRSEHWVVVKGIAHVTCNDQEIILNEGESTYIRAKNKHRLENQQTKDLEIIEIQIGDYLGEDDIVRFEDIYGRKN